MALLGHQWWHHECRGGRVKGIISGERGLNKAHPYIIIRMSSAKVKIACELCGKSFVNLRQHITKSHSKVRFEFRGDDSKCRIFYNDVLHSDWSPCASTIYAVDGDNGYGFDFKLPDGRSGEFIILQNSWDTDAMCNDFSKKTYKHNIQVVRTGTFVVPV